MKTHIFHYTNDKFNGFRQYLVDNYNSTKYNYLQISGDFISGHTEDYVWDTSGNYHISSVGTENNPAQVLLTFRHASFALTHLTFVYHNGPSKPSDIILEGSNNNQQYDELFEIKWNNQQDLTFFQQNKKTKDYKYIKFKLVGKNLEDYYILNFVTFDLFGTYIYHYPTIKRKYSISYLLFIMIFIIC